MEWMWRNWVTGLWRQFHWIRSSANKYPTHKNLFLLPFLCVLRVPCGECVSLVSQRNDDEAEREQGDADQFTALQVFAEHAP
jgi:hypothetical protein